MGGFGTLGRRLASSAGLIACALAVLFWMPAIGIALITAALVILALLEFYKLLRQGNLPCYPLLGTLIGVIVTWDIAWTVLNTDARVHSDLFALVLVAAIAAVLLRTLLARQPGSPLLAGALTVLGLVYLVGLFSFFSLLVLGWHKGSLGSPLEPEGRMLFIYMGLVVKFSDSGAYFVGTRWGRHKLIPRISPNKTWEGLWGGLATGVLCSLVVWALARGHLGAWDFTLVDALVLGFLLSAAGVAGDLVESQVKRSVGAKDSGGVLPGMGGVLDVMDSLLLAAPVLYAYTRFFIAP
jgi:phosphatidate cytidylyltransferase